MAVRRAVLGVAHVDRALAATTDLDRDFQRLLTEFAWGSVWSRPGLDRRTRRLVTMALLAALGHDEELAMHARAGRDDGLRVEDVTELLVHVAVYAGIPAVNHALRVVAPVFAEVAGDRGGDDG